ncbi:MAG TPA: response regulator [Polyangia bacterium]|jgi:signal transduction histidine kinase
MSDGGRTLRVLIIEDAADHAALLERELRRGGYEPAALRVDSLTAVAAALEEQPWDVILSDYALPGFDALTAFDLVQEKRPETPFILVSGAIGEGVAVEAMKAGVYDYIPKGRLGRLIPVVERAVREHAIRVERARMQQQLLASERMATLGVLGAGVAHEINNPLSYVKANLDLLAEALETAAAGGEPLPAAAVAQAREWAQRAREGAERIRVIVRGLRTFSRVDDETVTLCDVRRVLDAAVGMVWNEIKHRARLVRDYGELPPVRANEARLGQVFLNLLVNAAQAFGDTAAPRNEIRLRARAADGCVGVEVEDNGCGIAEENLPRLFEPFFTTKPIGEGTGLGLGICHGIVTGLGGTIDVESRLRRGTVFRVTLPAASPEAVAELSGPVAVTAPAGRRGRILIIDDEEMLCSTMQAILRAHEVVTATSAGAALARLTAGERFDIIFCDMMMPDMTGMDLHRRLRETAPEQAERIVFMTGGAFTPRAREFLAEVPNLRLAKPFDMHHLLAMARELLAR